MSTIANTIAVAKVTSVLANRDLAKAKIFGNKIRTTDRFPLMITTERKIIEKIYNSVPSYPNLQIASDYLYDLCGKYILAAQAIVDGGGGGSVIPITPVTSSNVFPIYITEANFSTSTEYNDTRIVGENLIVFYNQIDRYLKPGVEVAYTATGFQVLLAGFDAKAVGAEMDLVIERYSAGQAAGGSGSSLLISTYYGDTDYYSDLIANNDIVPYNGTTSGVQDDPMTVTFASGASDPAGKFLVFKVASSQNDKGAWSNTGTLNTGTIPDSVFRELISFGGYDYYCTRIAYVFDPSFLTMVLT